VDGRPFCRTLEDAVREVPGEPVWRWKVPGETAIPAGTYRLALVDSPRFGPGTIAVLGVPGFSAVRIHGGNTVDDTEGCILVRHEADEARGVIRGAKAHGVLAALKEAVGKALAAGEDAELEVKNAA